MTASNPSASVRIHLSLLTLILALTTLAKDARGSRTHRTGAARGPTAPTTPTPTKIKITKPYIVPSTLHRKGIPLVNYRPRPLRVFGKRARVTVYPDLGVIRRFIRKARRDLSRCYRKHVLSRHPKRRGRGEVGFTIGTTGRVTAVRVRRSALRDRPLERCLAKVLRKLRFPRVGAIIHVIYPSYFRPK